MTQMLLYLESLFSVASYTSHYMELFQTLGAVLFIACVISFGANCQGGTPNLVLGRQPGLKQAFILSRKIQENNQLEAGFIQPVT